MDALQEMIWFRGKFLGIDWGMWKVIGWAGNLAFVARWIIQWRASAQREDAPPVAFWWCSLAGSVALLAYSLCWAQDSVFIAAYLFAWLPYLRNVVLHHRHIQTQLKCRICQRGNPPDARFCMECGKGLPVGRR